jgi:hypothetical protein
MTQFTPQSHKKGFNEMTLHELREEEAFWSQEIEKAEQWGAAVGVTHSFLKDCRRFIARKEKEQQNEKSL